MGASSYIVTPAEKETYDITLATVAEIYRASSLVDHYLRRPKGCVWVSDAVGRPLYMEGATSSLTYTTTAVMTPGANVRVSVPGYVTLDDSLIGDVLVLDRNLSTAEAVTVNYAAPGTIGFATVLFAHDGTTTPITMDRGLVIDEEHSMPGQRSITQLAEWPVVSVLGSVGRYGYGRRDEQTLGYYQDLNLISTMAAFGGPPQWSPFSIPQSSLNQWTGTFWVPAGALLSYYTDVKVRYIAGWQRQNLPNEIKIATASIVRSTGAAAMGPMVRKFNTGKVQIERFSATVLDNDTKMMLRPYMANWMV